MDTKKKNEYFHNSNASQELAQPNKIKIKNKMADHHRISEKSERSKNNLPFFFFSRLISF